MALSKAEREALPDSDFAVPGKRALPIHDAKHTSMAWDMVERTKDLTPEERGAARHRIMERAKELGMDTSGWSKLKAASLEAMALSMPDGDGHPNRMPFSGVLIKLDVPSDKPPGGTGGRRIVLTKAAAEKALPTLLGMAVDFTPEFDGHDVQKKIGIITAANVVDDEIQIEGFVYAADFPDTAARIRAAKRALGFSIEAQDLVVADPGADPLVIEDCVLTGAAILRKDKAAYTTTSLAASAAGDIEMTKEELQAVLAEALKPVNEKIASIEASQTKIEATRVEAANLLSKVEPHASACEAAADSMEAAGIGADPQNGHAAVLRRMAGQMRAAAAVGKIPHIFRDHDYPAYAAADTKADDPKVKDLEAQVKSLESVVKDLKASAADTKPAPERKTLSPQVTAILAKAGLDTPEGDGKLTAGAVDKALAHLSVTERLRIKASLGQAGVLA
jgi:hypothetical protein